MCLQAFNALLFEAAGKHGMLASTLLTMLRCDNITPLGIPVVPEV